MPVTVDSTQPLKMVIRRDAIGAGKSSLYFVLLLAFVLWANYRVAGARADWLIVLLISYNFLSSFLTREVVELHETQLIVRRLFGNRTYSSREIEYGDIEAICWNLGRSFLDFGVCSIEIVGMDRRAIKFARGQSKKDIRFIRQQIKASQPALASRFVQNGLIVSAPSEETNHCPESGAPTV